jgi:hypothetical protein
MDLDLTKTKRALNFGRVACIFLVSFSGIIITEKNVI